ncbi:MAG: hypothetical protein KA928_02210 [Longilinea sp.]|nr:hypothetical protein [Longilinea sp.]
MSQVVKNYTLKSDIRCSGFLVGLSCAFVGTALFSVIEVAQLAIEDSFSPFLLSLIPAIIFYGFMFSSIPAGIGGLVLGLLLQNKMHKGSLTLAKSVKAGILLAGVAATITCACGILFLLLTPHGGWFYFWDDVRQGTFFINFPNYLHYYLELATRFALEILIAITIACIAGGWTGRVLTKQLLSAGG